MSAKKPLEQARAEAARLELEVAQLKQALLAKTDLRAADRPETMKEYLRRRQYHLVVETVTEYAMFLLDPEGRITCWNKGAERIKGYTEAEALGRHFRFLYIPEDVAKGRPEKNLAWAAAHDDYKEQAWRLRKDGSRFWADVVITAVRNDEGVLVGFSKIVRDKTDHKRAEEQMTALNQKLAQQNARVESEVTERTKELVEERSLREHVQAEQIGKLEALDRLKNYFLTATSHEIRTPLTSIVGYIEFLEDGLGGPLTPEQRQFLEHIKAGSRRLQYLVNDLLDFGRLEAGVFLLHPQPADLIAVVREEVGSLRPQAEENGITLTLAFSVHSLPIEIDARRIGQVLLNLVGNAIKFMTEGGHVTVSVEPSESEVRVEVRDDGPGISEENLPRLFSRFYQIDPRHGRGGTGLGLALSKAIVEEHGGRIGVLSHLGHGSTFWFTLPRRLKRAARPSVSRAAEGGV